MSTAVRIGVVGLGYWGPNLVRNFQSLPGVRVGFVCDTDPKRLEHLQTLYRDIRSYSDFDKALRDEPVEAVAIATPVSSHHRLARASLLAGKHTFIEKPMASSARQCAELVELAGARELELMVGHTFLYSPAIRKIREIVASGEIGEVLYISMRRLNLGLFQKDINVVWDLAPHDLSIVRFIQGESPVAVNCQGGSNVTRGIEDVSNLTLHFRNGSVAMIHSSWLDPKKVRDMAIVGRLKMIHYDDLEPLQKIKIYDQRVEVPPHYDTYAEFHYAYHYGDMYAPHIKQEEPLKVECEHFIRCIRDGETPLTNGRFGLEVVHILEAADRSLRRNGARVPVPEVPGRARSRGKKRGR